VVAQARRAQCEGEVVRAAERVFSIFEPHTELLKAWSAAEAGGVWAHGVVVPIAGEVHHRLRSL